MLRFLGVLVIVCALVVCLGLFMGWFTIGTTSTDGKSHVTFEVDKDKIKESERKAEDTVRGIGQKAKESVGR